MTDEELQGLFSKALKSDVGIELATNDPATLRRRFYKLRKALKDKGDLSLDGLTVRIMGEKTVHVINRGEVNGEG